MAIGSASTLKTDAWQEIYNVINTDEKVKNYCKKVYAAYPDIFIERGGGLPFIVIDPPDVIESAVTLTNTKDYTITFTVHCAVGGEVEISKRMKKLADAVVNAILNAESNLQTAGLYNLTITGDTKDFDIREGNKVTYDVITVEFTYFGG